MSVRAAVLLKGLLGLLAGLAGGAIVTVGLVVARVHLEGAFLEESSQVIGWLGAPLLLGPLLGAWIGAAHPPGRSIAMWCAFGLAAGALVGGLLFDALSARPAAPWAGSLMGAAAGVLLGVWTGLLRHYRRVHRHRLQGGELREPRPLLLAVAVTALFLLPVGFAVARLQGPEAPSVPYLEPEPDPTAVESVILLLGDAGEATAETHPILPRVRAEVERWAGALARDSAVVVVLLGDIVYPKGVHAADAPTRAEDSTRVAHQAALVGGANGAARGARVVFLAGNHDWGERRGPEGEAQLRHLEEVLTALRVSGGAVELSPPAGSGGPGVLDVGEHLRLVTLDTSWWLLTDESERKDGVIQGVGEALRTAGGRRVVVAAHHPFISGGPHGGLAALGENLGLRALLSRAGALLQDLNSRPYQELRDGLLATFAAQGPPALFAGGHEHSMQLLRGAGDEPPFTVVSGSGSKLSEVGVAPGLVFARAEPGFARLLVLGDGSLHLSIETAPAEYQSCSTPAPERERCMTAGEGAFRTVWSERLAPAR